MPVDTGVGLRAKRAARCWRCLGTVPQATTPKVTSSLRRAADAFSVGALHTADASGALRACRSTPAWGRARSARRDAGVAWAPFHKPLHPKRPPQCREPPMRSVCALSKQLTRRALSAHDGRHQREAAREARGETLALLGHHSATHYPRSDHLIAEIRRCVQCWPPSHS